MVPIVRDGATPVLPARGQGAGRPRGRRGNARSSNGARAGPTAVPAIWILAGSAVSCVRLRPVLRRPATVGLGFPERGDVRRVESDLHEEGSLQRSPFTGELHDLLRNLGLTQLAGCGDRGRHHRVGGTGRRAPIVPSWRRARDSHGRGFAITRLPLGTQRPDRSLPGFGAAWGSGPWYDISLHGGTWTDAASHCKLSKNARSFALRTSANRTVTNFRSPSTGRTTSSGVPRFRQNLAPSGFTIWQLGSSPATPFGKQRGLLPTDHCSAARNTSTGRTTGPPYVRIFKYPTLLQRLAACLAKVLRWILPREGNHSA